jgi:hypothetical protein
MPHGVELTARHDPDLQGGRPDYSIWAIEQRVGRIYQTHSFAPREQWFWGVNAVTLDMTVGVTLHGYATSFEDARAKFRVAFDHWLEWALEVPRGDMKYPRISAELMKMKVI